MVVGCAASGPPRRSKHQRTARAGAQLQHPADVWSQQQPAGMGSCTAFLSNSNSDSQLRQSSTSVLRHQSNGTQPSKVHAAPSQLLHILAQGGSSVRRIIVAQRLLQRRGDAPCTWHSWGGGQPLRTHTQQAPVSVKLSCQRTRCMQGHRAAWAAEPVTTCNTPVLPGRCSAGWEPERAAAAHLLVTWSWADPPARHYPRRRGGASGCPAAPPAGPAAPPKGGGGGAAVGSCCPRGLWVLRARTGMQTPTTRCCPGDTTTAAPTWVQRNRLVCRAAAAFGLGAQPRCCCQPAR